jgi:hypothetical protein
METERPWRPIRVFSIPWRLGAWGVPWKEVSDQMATVCHSACRGIKRRTGRSQGSVEEAGGQVGRRVK